MATTQTDQELSTEARRQPHHSLVGLLLHTSLGPILLLSLAGYFVLLFWFPLNESYNVAPLADVRKLSPSLRGGIAYAGLLVSLFFLLGLAHRRVRLLDGKHPPAWAILLFAVLLAAPLLFTFPVNATDVYRYFLRGRIMSVYADNPFVTAPAAFPADPYTILAGEWSTATSPYGPLWELVASAVAWLSQDSLWRALLMFKALGLLGHLAVALLIWLLGSGQPPDRRMGRFVLWAWNPALLLTFVANAHNDVLMLLWLMLGYWLWRRGNSTAAFFVMLLAPLTKPVGALPLPLLYLAMWREQQGSGRRLRFLLTTLLGAALITSLAFLPFGAPLALASRLLREASANGGFSPVTLLILGLRTTGWDTPSDLVVAAGTLLFLILALILLWLVWRGRPAARAAADVFATYLGTAFTFRIWYSTWPFSWLLVDREAPPWRLHAGLWFLLTAQLSVVIYGHVYAYVLERDQFIAHMVGVPLVFLLPLLLAPLSAHKRLFGID